MATAEAVRIEAPDASTADSLLQELASFGSQLVALEGERWAVSVGVSGSGRHASAQVDRILAVVDQWLGLRGLRWTAIRVGGGSYVLRVG